MPNGSAAYRRSGFSRDVIQPGMALESGYFLFGASGIEQGSRAGLNHIAAEAACMVMPAGYRDD
jgi:hypothetical protein